MDGIVDEYRVFGRTLSQREVQSLSSTTVDNRVTYRAHAAPTDITLS